jgi:predicted SAM-dependent methyltransferase
LDGFDIKKKIMASRNYINLGCGAHFHKDWVNVDFAVTGKDVIAYNLNFGIPFQNDSFDVVYHSHLLEHFAKKDAKYFISECYRVLKNDGIIRVAIPDLEQIINEYQKQLQGAVIGEEKSVLNYDWIRNVSGGQMAEFIYQEKLENEEYIFKRIGLEGKNLRRYYLEHKGDGPNPKVNTKSLKQKIRFAVKRYLVEWSFREKFDVVDNYLKIGKFRQSGEIHQWMYDRHSLSMLLQQYGFKKIEVKTAYDSQIPEFSKFNLDVVEGEIRKPDSLFIEAIK